MKKKKIKNENKKKIKMKNKLPKFARMSFFAKM
jgi:hypothetical protein